MKKKLSISLLTLIMTLTLGVSTISNLSINKITDNRIISLSQPDIPLPW